ncbi:MAG TPA: MOSC domain-containing protein, partial [Pirellulaceae bacterium]
MGEPERSGRLVWIGLRPRDHGPIQVVEQVMCDEEYGLVGDRYRKRHGDRQVTLFQFEDLARFADVLAIPEVRPEQVRRNLGVAEVDLLSFQDSTFSIGNVTLAGTGLCDPCERMEETLGSGGQQAMLGRGGITARIVQGGTIRCGDRVGICSP